MSTTLIVSIALAALSAAEARRLVPASAAHAAPAPATASAQTPPAQTPPAQTRPAQTTAAQPTTAPADAPSLARFNAWLEAFNSADRQKIKQFVDTQAPGRADRIDNDLAFSRMTGGFTVRKIVEVTPARVVVFAEERGGDNFVRIAFDVDPAPPHAMIKFEPNIIPRPAEYAIPRLTAPALVDAVRAATARDAKADTYAGAIIVAKRNATLYSGASGLADREKKIPNTLDTRFRIGSMNKMITAVAILQLAQAGKVTLTEPFGTYVTDYPNKAVASKVTLHHLLTHTGGTGDIFTPAYAERRLQTKTLDDYVTLYGTRDVEFEPGSRWSYSNYGFILLGVVIERVTGGSYYDYVRDKVYAPAGMTATGSEPESEAVPNRSVGYMRSREPGSSGAWMPNTDTLPYRGTSAGGGYSTVGDLLRFANAILDHKLLNAEYTTLLLAGKVDLPGPGGGPAPAPGKPAGASGTARPTSSNMYAYGFMDRTDNGLRRVGHGGGAPGQNGELTIYPDSGYIVVSLANLDPPVASRFADFINNRLPK